MSSSSVFISPLVSQPLWRKMYNANGDPSHPLDLWPSSQEYCRLAIERRDELFLLFGADYYHCRCGTCRQRNN